MRASQSITRPASDDTLVGCERLPLLPGIAHVEGAGVLDTDLTHHQLSFVQYSPRKYLCTGSGKPSSSRPSKTFGWIGMRADSSRSRRANVSVRHWDLPYRTKPDHPISTRNKERMIFNHMPRILLHEGRQSGGRALYATTRCTDSCFSSFSLRGRASTWLPATCIQHLTRLRLFGTQNAKAVTTWDL